jgi:hypothetical protein
MTRFAKNLLIVVLALAAAIPLASGQTRVATFARAEIDQMLAPIALYPDPLLSQLLMAATFPTEVVEAARWSRAHPGVEGDAAVRMVQDFEWDPSVKSLVAFPQVLTRMDENLEWTQKLGEAFIVQEPVVMEAVQDLRRRAHASGQLASDERQRIIEQPEAIAIEPVNPEYVYVPYYDPRIIYGSWWWPGYPPYYWAPWPGYVRGYYPGYWWGAPIGLSVGFFFGGFDWHRRHAHVHRVDNYYVRPTWVNRYSNYSTGRWQRNYWQRSGSYTRYSDSVNRQQFQSSVPLRDSRREERRSFERRNPIAPQQQQVAPQQQQVAPQQVAPRQQSFAPRDTAPRLETRQGFQGTPERRRDFDRAERQAERLEQRQTQPQLRQAEPRRFEQRQAQPLEQRQPEPRRLEQRQAQPQPQLRQAEPRRFEPRQQAAPSAPAVAPRFERREQRIEQRTQRSEQRIERSAERNESRGGGRRFN